MYNDGSVRLSSESCVHMCYIALCFKKILRWEGRAVVQAISRRPLTAEARGRSQISPYGICGRQSGTGIGFFPSTSVLLCQSHSTGPPLHGKTKKKNCSSSSQGCTVRFAAVRP
jgi:hypothetical protein